MRASRLAAAMNITLRHSLSVGRRSRRLRVRGIVAERKQNAVDDNLHSALLGMQHSPKQRQRQVVTHPRPEQLPCG